MDDSSLLVKIGIFVWSVAGSLGSIAIMQNKTANKFRINVYACLGFFGGVFGILLALVAQSDMQKENQSAEAEKRREQDNLNEI
ncbi:MAG: hypothetical protein RDV48_15550 [Candidatus Eremiobacteraeota bacterium]|nr:hypothetical protein [Candidatus Eremiobacteraeota bacterium]